MNEQVKTCGEVLSLMRHIHHNIMHIYQERLDKKGMYVGMPYLMALIDKHPDYSQKEFAEKMHFSEPAMSTAIKKLKQRKLVDQVSCKEDMRFRSLVLTDEGRKTLEGAKAVMNDHLEGMFAGFDPKERRAFVDYLTRIAENIELEKYEEVKEC